MKKTFLFIIVMLTCQAWAQNSQPAINPAANHQQAQPLPTVRVIDSIYYWDCDRHDTAWELQAKTTHIVYDNANNWISDLDHFWWENIWWNDTLTSYTYDANHNMTNKVFKMYYENTWYDYMQWIYTYNSNNKLLSNTYQEFYGFDSTWHNLERWIYTYDLDNNLIDETFQRWHTDITAWENAIHHVFTYDNNNNCTSKLIQAWGSENWYNYELTTYTYDNENNQILYVRQQWISGEWLNEVKVISTYGSGHKLLNEIIQIRSGTDWYNDFNVIWTYDTFNNLVCKLYQRWTNYTYWEDDFRMNYTYDASNNLLSEVWSGWDHWTGIWTDYRRYLFTYDVNNFNIGYSNIVLDESGMPLGPGDSIHYYSHMELGINERPVEKENVTVFPNPANGEFKISSKNPMSSVEIYNAPGAIVHAEYNLNGQQEIDLKLPPHSSGIYFIKVNIGTNYLIKKVIVR